MIKKIALAIAALSLASCGVCKHCPPIVEYRDSIVVHERIVHDTATFAVPVEVEKIVTRDTASHLENSFAKSDAVVKDGFLYHSLETKPQTISIPIDIPVTDTTSYHSEKPEPDHIEVEKPLSWWQNFRIGAFWWLILLSVIGFRKEILALIKKLLKFVTL